MKNKLKLSTQDGTKYIRSNVFCPSVVPPLKKKVHFYYEYTKPISYFMVMYANNSYAYEIRSIESCFLDNKIHKQYITKNHFFDIPFKPYSPTFKALL